MNNLDLAIKDAIASQGENRLANKAYLEFIKANFIIPVDVNSSMDNPEVLYLQEGENTFLPVFTEMDYLHEWAENIQDSIQILRLSGVDLLKGIGEHVTVCLNINSSHYKEFYPSELARMRSMILKLFK